MLTIKQCQDICYKFEHNSLTFEIAQPIDIIHNQINTILSKAVKSKQSAPNFITINSQYNFKITSMNNIKLIN